MTTFSFKPFSLDTITRKLRERAPFTFSRWGDGEWRAVLGVTRGVNCDGHPYFPDMGDELRQVLRDNPKYVMGIQRLAIRVYGERIERWLDNNKLTIKWVESDVLHIAARDGRLDSFVRELRRRRVVLAGPDHLKRINRLIPYKHFVDVPPRNAYLAKDRIIRGILSAVEAEDEPAVVSISASMPAEIIIHELYCKLGKQHTLFDAGSLWDQYVGVKSRGYMKAGTPEPIVDDSE